LRCEIESAVVEEGQACHLKGRAQEQNRTLRRGEQRQSPFGWSVGEIHEGRAGEQARHMEMEAILFQHSRSDCFCKEKVAEGRYREAKHIV